MQIYFLKITHRFRSCIDKPWCTGLYYVTGKSFPCLSAPSTPPQFLHARKLSDYEVELSWQPPMEANSDVLYYIVRVWWVFFIHLSLSVSLSNRTYCNINGSSVCQEWNDWAVAECDGDVSGSKRRLREPLQCFGVQLDQTRRWRIADLHQLYHHWCRCWLIVLAFLKDNLVILKIFHPHAFESLSEYLCLSVSAVFLLAGFQNRLTRRRMWLLQMWPPPLSPCCGTRLPNPMESLHTTVFTTLVTRLWLNRWDILLFIIYRHVTN